MTASRDFRVFGAQANVRDRLRVTRILASDRFAGEGPAPFGQATTAQNDATVSHRMSYAI